jgi:G:T-mismatch repair DNA endonuclease (very short patch repair protein)
MEKRILTKRGKKIKRPDLIGNSWNFGKTPWNKGLNGDKYLSHFKNRETTSGAYKLKGKTYEEIYGPEKARELKQKNIVWNKNLRGEEYTKHFKNGAQSFARHQLKGKTFEEIYGPEKAKEQKIKRTKTIKQYYINGTATLGFPTDGTMKEKRANQIFPKQDTSIEIKIQNFLKELKIGFFTHYYCKEINHAYQCDIFIPVQKNKDRFIKQPIIIECDGDWWHGNINHPRYKVLTEAQRCQREEDYVRTRELEKAGFKVIRLWESEIKNLDLTIFKNKIGLPIR